MDALPHALGSITQSFYPFVMANAMLDYVYLYSVLVMQLSWTVLKGECAVSLISKLRADPNYKIGSDIAAKDLTALYSRGGKYLPIIMVNLTAYAVMIGSILVLIRRKFSMAFVIFAGCTIIAVEKLIYLKNYTLNYFLAALLIVIMIVVGKKINLFHH